MTWRSELSYLGEGVKLGKDVKIWHFTYIGDGVELGDEVVVGSLVHLDRGVKVGRGTRIQGSTYIPPGTVIGERVFIGPGVVFTNDPYPPSRRLAGVVVEDEAVIGAGAVLRGGVRVGRRSVVGMGSVVVGDVPEGVVVAGVPAKPIYTRDEYDRRRGEWEERLVG